VLSGRNVTANYLNCVRMRTEKFANIFLARRRLLHPASCAVSASVSAASAPAVYPVSWHPVVLASWHSATPHLPLHQQHYPVLSVRAGMLWGDICRLVDKIAEMLLLFQLIKMSSVLGTPWEKWDKGEKVLN